MQVMIEEHISHPRLVAGSSCQPPDPGMMAESMCACSIVMWVVFNEGWGQYETERVTRLARSLDSSRLVNCASGWHAPDLHLLHFCHSAASRPLMWVGG